MNKIEAVIFSIALLITTITLASAGILDPRLSVLPILDKDEYLAGDIVTIDIRVINRHASVLENVTTGIHGPSSLEFIDPTFYNLGSLNPNERRDIIVRAKAAFSGTGQIVANADGIDPVTGENFSNSDFTHITIKENVLVPEFPLGIAFPIAGILGIILLISRKRKD